MEDASCDVDSTTLSDSQTDLTNHFEQDLSELNDLIDDVTEVCSFDSSFFFSGSRSAHNLIIPLD